MFSIPEKFHTPDLKADRTAQHWINLFGNNSSAADRIAHIIEINKSAFIPDSIYAIQIQDLAQQLTYLPAMVVEVYLAPKDLYESQLPTNILGTRPTKHHIIFKNTVLGGNRREKDNIVRMDEGEHISFHALINQKSLYPHQQLSTLLKHESDSIHQSDWERLKEIEQDADLLFKNDPFELYKEGCFSKNFIQTMLLSQ